MAAEQAEPGSWRERAGRLGGLAAGLGTAGSTALAIGVAINPVSAAAVLTTLAAGGVATLMAGAAGAAVGSNLGARWHHAATGRWPSQRMVGGNATTRLTVALESTLGHERTAELAPELLVPTERQGYDAGDIGLVVPRGAGRETLRLTPQDQDQALASEARARTDRAASAPQPASSLPEDASRGAGHAPAAPLPARAGEIDRTPQRDLTPRLSVRPTLSAQTHSAPLGAGPSR